MESPWVAANLLHDYQSIDTMISYESVRCAAWPDLARADLLNRNKVAELRASPGLANADAQAHITAIACTSLGRRRLRVTTNSRPETEGASHGSAYSSIGSQ